MLAPVDACPVITNAARCSWCCHCDASQEKHGRFPNYLADVLVAILVAGQIYVAPNDRERFLAGSREAMVLARRTRGCDDFVVAPDPLDDSRVNVFERWRSAAELHAFREEGPDDGLSALIVRADVHEYEV